MPYREPPSEEELKRLSATGDGCRDCESKGTHGGRTVCRRQIAGRYNREITRNYLASSGSRPPWCPKNTRGLQAGTQGYATDEPLSEKVGTGTKDPEPPYQTGPASPMPVQGPAKTLATGRMKSSEPAVQNIPPPKKEEPPPPKKKLKRQPKDAPWGQTEDK